MNKAVIQYQYHQDYRGRTELGVFQKKEFLISLDIYANGAGATAPAARDEAISGTVIGKGDPAVMCAFGGGLCWGG